MEIHIIIPKKSPKECCKSLMDELEHLSDEDWATLEGVRVFLISEQEKNRAKNE